MKFLQGIHPAKPWKYLKWFDILIVTVLMFGEFVIRSTQNLWRIYYLKLFLALRKLQQM